MKALAFLTLAVVVAVTSSEELSDAVVKQIEAMVKPSIKLACCTEAGIEGELKECVKCVKDKSLVEELLKKGETYKKDKGNYCDDKGNPKEAEVTAAIEKEKAAFKADTNAKRYLKAVCVKGCVEKLIEKYKAKCKI